MSGRVKRQKVKTPESGEYKILNGKTSRSERTGKPLVSAKFDDFPEVQIDAKLTEKANELVAEFEKLSPELGKMTDEQLRMIRPADFKIAYNNYVNIYEIIENMLNEMSNKQKKEYLCKAEKMFKKMNNDLEYSHRAYEALGEWVKANLGGAAEGFVEMAIDARNDEDMLRICKDYGPEKSLKQE